MTVETFDYSHLYSFINLFEQQVQRYADNTFVRYQLPNTQEFKTMTYCQIDRIANNLANKWAPAVQGVDSIGLVADHSIYYMISMLAIFKLQPALLALSPRNSVAANVDLLTKTGSHFLVASKKYSALVKECAEQVPGGCGVSILSPLDLEHLNSYTSDFKRAPSTKDDIEKIALIIHSSGSTSFPKPIRLSNRYLYWLVQVLSFQMQQDAPFMNSSDVMLSSMPLFHVFGVFTNFMPILFGASCMIFGRLPPTPRELAGAIDKYGVTMMGLPPMILEQVAEYIEDTQNDSFSRIKFCLYGGAALRKPAGDFLNARGMNVRSVYGTTEINAMAVSNITQGYEQWYAFRPALPLIPYCIWEPHDEAKGIYHLVIKADCPALATNAGNRPNGDYATNDLFMEDPPKSGYWRHLGRNDDTLVMENGEKTNPVPMEHRISSAKVVRCCTVIGENKQCTAALVELDQEHAHNYTPEETIAQVREAVERANNVAPSHSTILPQMIYILPLSRQLPTTLKGNVVRKRAIIEFQEQIDKMYNDFFQGPATTATGAADGDAQLDIDAFLAQAAVQVLRKSPIDANASLFDYGLNSLLAIQLRNRLATRFENVPSNFLFEHPTLASMKEALTAGEPQDQDAQREARYQDTQALLDDYIKRADADFPVAPKPIKNARSKEQQTVLLSGATGSLGAFMLRDLILSPNVKKIYCLVRGNNLMQRLHKSFQDRLLDTSLLEKDNKVEALTMQLDKPYLGWEEATYNKLKKEVTIIQHCAWLLDFNQPVQHFDRECIRGLYNLLQFAYRKEDPIHVHVVSSISATAAYGKDTVPELPSPKDPHVAMPMGYAQSKYIVEHLFHYLTQQKNFPCIVERMGQVCGDTEHGVWNTSEQYPLLMVGGTQLGLMPNLASVTVDWLPVDFAATSIVTIMLKLGASNQFGEGVYHIVNPSRVGWSDVLKAMQASGMKFDVVEPEQWVEALSKHQDNPAYRLMSFFEANFQSSSSSEETATMPVWETEKTAELAPVLAQAPAFGETLLKKHLAFWRNVGFYNPTTL
ncbi:hypothetical protein BDB00DRAFT_773619 [Zychaea mexicana]|uniref:uncharacterized protein n=1 Tax=Zychaea mexicana TaxID=64656 RepID=UPI0022FDE481|nr:uncharacterized protein BDB00DRAFT_773619 [Zychaea mexicana]KAI9485154.1 hypothetical protein BDB00DRAFT_773619 [Zychaea mexicana]